MPAKLAFENPHVIIPYKKVDKLMLKSLLSSGRDEFIAKGDAARDRGDWRAATEAYAAGLKADPRNAPIWVQYGHALKESGRLVDAEHAYRRSLEIAPEVADTHLQLGHVLKLQGELANALDAYNEALRLAPRDAKASREIAALSELGFSSSFASGRLNAAIEARTVFDCSDLVHYFSDNRIPTGIQRVQINIISSYPALTNATRACAVVFFDQPHSAWRMIPLPDFQRLVRTAQAIDGVPDTAWEAIRAQITGEGAPIFRFVRNDILVNLGTSWWISDYFLHVRNLKETRSIRYVPFIHDCIPLITPEHCSLKLSQQFRNWIEGVFAHSDAYFVNSNSTARDLVATATQLGYRISEPTVVRLDGDASAVKGADSNAEQGVAELLLKERLPSDVNFVLMVGTLESRKNHMLALQLWDRLLSERGEERTPFLLCVGKRGWHFEATERLFRSRSRLARRVRFVSNVGDAVLADLYQRTLFTLYPSHYEGWGMPVTESLCHGKVPLVSENSALTEAGGPFAVYFEPGSARQAYERLSRLIDDTDYRQSLEREIAANFRARSWEDVASDIGTRVEALHCDFGHVSLAGLPAIDPGIIYEFSTQAPEPSAGRVSGQHARLGHGWHACEDWGVWTRTETVRVGLVLRKAGAKGAIVYVGLRGNPVRAQRLRIECPETGDEGVYMIPTSSDMDVKLRLSDLDAEKLQITLLFTVDNVTSLAGSSDGKDMREIGLGVRWFALANEDDLGARLAILEASSFASSLPLGRVGEF